MLFLKKIKDVFKENDIDILEYTEPKKFIKYKCLTCGQIYTAQTAVSLLSKITLCEKCWLPFKRWNVERLQKYKLKRIFPNSQLQFIEFNGYKNKGKIKCLKCGFIKEYNSLPAILRRTGDCFCECCEEVKNKIYQYTLNNLPETIELVEWRGAALKNLFFCKNCNKTFERKIDLQSKMDYCPYCNNNIHKFSLQQAQEKIDKEKEGYTILNYGGQRGRSLIKHSCGFCFTCNLDSFAKSRGCPKCFGKMSKLEKTIESFLIKNNYSFDVQKRFSDLKKYSFDFIVFFNNSFMLIEAQGRQHYEDVSIFDSFENQQKRDEVKRQYCLVNDIPLIEFPYWEESNVENFLLDKFNDYLERE